MATEVHMPKLGLTMEEGTIEEWKVKEGDTVKKGDIIFSVSTDKMTNDIEAEADGVLIKILVPEGETAPCKSVIAYLGAAGETAPAAGAPAAAPAAAPAPAAVPAAAAPTGPAAKEVHMPKLGLTMEEGTVEEWKKKEGDTVKKGDILFSVATDKMTNDIEAEYDGTLLKIVVKEGDTAPCKSVIAYIGNPGDACGAAPAATAPAAAAPAAAPAGGNTITVIGGGPGGYVAAIRASQLGAKVTLIEKDHVGGTCLNRGCIPTKSLMHCAETYETVKNAASLGITASKVEFDWNKIQSFRQGITDKLVGGVKGLLKMNKVKLIEGEAKFSGDKTVTVTKTDGSTETITSDKVIIASGSEPAMPPIPGIDAPACINSTQALTMDHVPASLLVIGGGVIGLELGSVYNTFGTKVTVVEMLPEILPAMDSELTKIVKNQLTAAGMDIRTGTSVEKIEKSRKGAKVTVKGANGEEVIEVENVLVAVGRKVDPAAINASATGLTTLEANDKMETSVPGVYSIGDANGKWMLAYTAMTMGEIAAANATGGDMTFDRKSVPSVIFLGPEFAGVGLTEDEAKAKGISYKVGKFSMSGNGRSLVMGQTDGMIKVIADTKYNEILGVHMVGPRACDMIAEASLALRLECTVDEWIDTVHAHPTVTEAMREAMLAVNKQCLHGANK
jgi:dihydrolipoamide dehydrogenase